MQTITFAAHLRHVILISALAVVAAGAAALYALTPPPGDEPAVIAAGEEPVTWEDVDRLVNEQKFEAASAAVTKIREAASARGDAAQWTRALVEEVKLRTALHGYETSVRFLREQPWPEDPTSRAVLDLYYAHSLVTYAHAYSWEIRQRERMVSDDEIDLKAWTLDQIVAESNRAFARLWADRADWGDESIGDLARYISQNNYPARIRGTLRDAVSYMWVELLVDSSLWRAGQSNELFKLEAAALIAGDPDTSSELDLSDRSVHPLEKVGAILDDLEAWHRANRRAEAAHEARLERLRRLHAGLDSSHDRVAIREHLEQRQSDFDRSLEWWSMGQSVLAEFLRSENDPDSLVRAREQAIAGRDRHPASLGGRRCEHIVAAIEAPAYAMTAMAADSRDRRSIRISHKNLDEIYLRAYSYDLLRHVRAAEDYGLLPDGREVEKMMRFSELSAEWTVELPATPDFRNHATFVTPPMTEPGAYVVIASARRDFRDGRNQIVAVNTIVGDLVLLTRRVPGAWEVESRSGGSGMPLAEAEVTLYRADWRRGHRAVATRSTGIDGIARFDTSGLDTQQHFLLASWKDHVAFDGSYLYPYAEGERGISSAAFVYTDRSVYRPQQTLHWKVVAYKGGGEEISYRTVGDAKITVNLVDANNETVASEQVSTNDFGSASGSFDIPAGRLLGQWRLTTSFGGNTPVRVEEYKRPTFEVSVSDPESPLRLNRSAELSGEARYYFGLPVAAGAVSWRVTREPVYPWWWWWWRPYAAVQSQVVAAGDAELDADGAFKIRFRPEADEREAESGVTFRFRLAVDVTDEGGETRSASRAFRLGFVAVEARISSETNFFSARVEGSLDVLRSDLDGTPRAGKARWRLVKLQQPDRTPLPADLPQPAPPDDDDRFRTPGDELRPRWEALPEVRTLLALWEDGRQLASGKLEHGDDGRAVIELPDLSGGVYRVVYTTEDDYGADYRTTHDFFVAGARATPVAVPALLEVERAAVPVGDTARLLVRSGIKDQEMVLEIFRDGKRSERRVLHAGHDAELIEIPVTAEDRGGFGVTLTVLRDHQLMRINRAVFVPWDDRELEVSFSTFRDTLRPGTPETFRISVRGHDEYALDTATAELLAYMYDRSLDIFAPHTPPTPIGIYPNRSGVGTLQSSLGTASQVYWAGSNFAPLPGYPNLHGDYLITLDGYGIGGMGRRGMGYAAKAAPGRMRQMAPSSASMDAMAVEEGMALGDEAEMDAPAESRMEAKKDGGEAATDEPVEMREEFSETAFFEPHLLLGDDGEAVVEFEVPDSVTEWNVWVHAITTDLRAGSTQRQTRSVKELMVRPYLPRFLREGDRATIRVVVNNAGEEPLSGSLDFDIADPDTGEDLGAAFALADSRGVSFAVEPGAGTTLEFPIVVPARVGTIAFTAVARAGDHSDGERRPLPVLPGRMHLVQSRFVTLRDADRRELSFADMAADDDPSLIHDQLVVTVDAQLFYSVLNALPYLVNYPYECTEQTLNRFLSTGIVTSLYDDYPSVRRMAEKFSERDTRLETWEAADPNRKMMLEESPWLQISRGGEDDPDDLINVLDPRIATAQRKAALAKLEQAQTSLGGFPWFPGGPPSPWMTLYILNGFSKALEFDVEVPKPMVVRAWSYMHRHYIEEMVDWMMSHDCCWETITYLNFVLSSYPDPSWTGNVFTDDEREQMLDFSFRHWKQHSPLLKGYLALTLERAGRHDDAMLVFESVMDSSKTDRDLGTYWAPEDRAWLWYNDTIETHAFALRTLAELEPDDGRRHGLVHWLLLNKKLNHWKSTRATAEVVYSLTHYLEKEGQLGAREDATVIVGPIRREFVFEPDEYTGARNRVIVPGEEIDPETMSTVVVEKSAKGFAFASATWHFSTERLPEEARGDLFGVQRSYFLRSNVDDEWVLEPLTDGTELEPGDQVEVHLSIRAKHAAEYVHLRDPRGAGFEPESLRSEYKWKLGIGWYEEIRDSGTNFFMEWLPAGEYTLKYRLRAAMGGTFKVGPATLQSMYAPEFAAYSAGHELEIAN